MIVVIVCAFAWTVMSYAQSSSVEKQLEELKKENAALKEANQKIKEELAREEDSDTGLYFSIGTLAILFLGSFFWWRKNKKALDKLRKVNIELESARYQAEKASKMKDLFVQNMSHEIRTPLNAVMGFSQILTCPGLPISEEEKEEYGSHIMNNVNLLTMLVDDILNVSDMESGKYRIHLKEDRIDHVCQSAYSVVQYRLPAEVEYRFVNELPEDFSCITDARRVQQVLVNYLSNACKHTVKGSIELRVMHNVDNHTIEFWVTDTGHGVPDADAENIFERFTKLDNFVQGTGLGLNICRSISKKMNGRVWLDTSYTDGARFCFAFPDNLKV